MPSVTSAPVSSAVRSALFSAPRNRTGCWIRWSDGSTIIRASPYFFLSVTAPQPMHGAVFLASGSHRTFPSGRSGSCVRTRAL